MNEDWRRYSPPQDTPLTPPSRLLTAALAFYIRAFRPLFLTAAAAAAIPALLDLFVQPQANALTQKATGGSQNAASPHALAFWFLWVVLVIAIETAAQSGVLWAAMAVRSARAVRPVQVAKAIVAFGPRYFASAFLLLAMTVLGAWSLVLMPLALLLLVRASLFGPAIVMEDQNILEGFKRSWKLTAGRWWRTFGMEAVVLAVPLAGSFLLTLMLSYGLNIAMVYVVDVLMTALVIPFVMCFFVLLFEDYRGANKPLLGLKQQ